MCNVNIPSVVSNYNDSINSDEKRNIMTNELVQQINNLLKEGWTIYGSIGIDTNSKGDKIHFHEMVIKQFQNG